MGPKNVELTGSIRSTYKFSNARFIQKARRDRDNDLHRDCKKYNSDFVLRIIGDDFFEQYMYEKIVPSVNVWKTAYQPSINVVVIEANQLVSHTRH